MSYKKGCFKKIWSGWKLTFLPASGFPRRHHSWRWVAILRYEPTTWRRKLWAGGNMEACKTFHTVEPPDHPGPTTFRVLLHERTISSCCVYATKTSCNWYSKQNNIQQYANCPSPLTALLHRWISPSFSGTCPRLLLPLCCGLILFPDSSSLH